MLQRPRSPAHHSAVVAAVDIGDLVEASISIEDRLRRLSSHY